MNREKELAKNTGIIAIGKLSSKLFTFLLLPLYTSVLLPEDYGRIDVLQTAVSLVMCFMTLQIESAVFRYVIDHRNNEQNRNQYISSGIVLVLINAAVFVGLILVFNVFSPIPYVSLFLLSLLVTAFSTLMRDMSRGLGHNILYSISSFVTTMTSLVVNIILILGFNMGAKSILIALAISNLTGGFVVFVCEKTWRIFSFGFFSSVKLKEMLAYSVPLVPNQVSWWIANTSDRLLILFFLGSSMNGIYAAANKIPTIYTTIFAVYNLAWTESVAMNIKDSDKEEYINSMMERSLRIFSFLALGIICCVSLFFDFLIGKNYASSYAHIYILLVAIFVNSLASLYGGVFAGFKDTKVTGVTTIIGAIVNFVINLLLIKVIGLYAASISTLVSYLVIFIARKEKAKKYVKIHWSKGFIGQVIILLGIVSVGYFYRNYRANIIILTGLIIWGIINNGEIIKAFFDALETGILNKNK